LGEVQRGDGDSLTACEPQASDATECHRRITRRWRINEALRQGARACSGDDVGAHASL